MQIIGFTLAIIIGIALGLIGSGGSILTIPVLVYVSNIAPGIATTYSLFIVGISALTGSFKGAKDHLLDFRMALYFGLPSVVSIFIMRKFLLPLLPDNLGTIAGFILTKNMLIMLVFSILMIGASFSMIRKTHPAATMSVHVNPGAIISKGILIGLLTGFVGVGGGFLIIPALLFSAKLPMNKAIATSLLIIAANSLIGFAGSMDHIQIEWKFLSAFTLFAGMGIFAGLYLRKKISNEKLKPAFGWFVLVTGVYILLKELLIPSIAN